MNEIAQAVSAVTELKISVETFVLDKILADFLAAHARSSEGYKVQYGGPSIGKMVFCLSKLSELPSASLELREGLVEAFEELPQTRADDRFKVIRHAAKFLATADS